MAVVDTLGVPAHRGGVLVARPELSVVLVRATARTAGLEIELLARRPLDRRSALERQSDIRAGRGGAVVAPRRLLPPVDEGLDLRVGWLDAADRPRWTVEGWSSSSGDPHDGTWGPSLRGIVELPPMFDEVRLVFAWPEIGFPETVVRLPLPDRASVERGTVSVWRVPVDSTPAPGPFRHHVADHISGVAHAEVTGRAGVPRVLARGADAVVVLNRLTYLGSALSLEIISDARGPAGRRASELGFGPGHRSPWPATGDQIRADGPGARIAVLRGEDAYWATPSEATAGGGSDTYTEVCEIAVPRPADGVLDLLVAWPLAGLPDVRARIALDDDGAIR